VKRRSAKRGPAKAPLGGREIVVGITGSIAAFKAAEVVSQLVQRGAGVTVVMSAAAAKFVGPLTFQTLTRRRVILDQFDLDSVLDPTHISLADEADLVVVAPATANFLGKAAHGIADDMLTSLLLAVTCPVLVAPAMNDRMWAHPAVQENVATLRKRGFRFVEPESGFLACGTYAKGRLADPARIVAEVERCVS
jgi:phosphopantothenoylcysteine decarboxylase/phosphopantothenate--cysteine ligase